MISIRNSTNILLHLLVLVRLWDHYDILLMIYCSTDDYTQPNWGLLVSYHHLISI